MRASARDERTLRFELDDEIFGFHAQQSVEKLLKILIAAHGEEFAFTHDLKRLVAQLERLGETIPAVEPGWDDLTQYALDVRYSSGVVLVDELRERIRVSIVTLREFVLRRAEELKQAGTQVRNP